MKISDLIAKLEAFKAEHGDLELESEYWCEDCHDEHTSDEVKLELEFGKLRMSVKRLGE